MVQKVPPPPMLTGPEWQAFNRWLLELTGILNGEGEIDPGSVAGLTALVNEVAAQGGDITTLQGTVAAQGVAITALQATSATHTTQINGLLARAQVFQGTGAPAAGLGAVGDWYGDALGAIGARIWIKTAPGTWTAFPF